MKEAYTDSKEAGEPQFEVKPSAYQWVKSHERIRENGVPLLLRDTMLIP